MSDAALDPSPWHFRGRLQEDQALFFRSLAKETGQDPTIFMRISNMVAGKYLRGSLQSMLKLTSLQMRNVIADCGGDADWIFTMEEMLGAKFAPPVDEAPSSQVLQQQSSQSRAEKCSVRISPYLEERETTLGRELYDQGLLEDLELPEDIFAVVTTPDPTKQ